MVTATTELGPPMRTSAARTKPAGSKENVYLPAVNAGQVQKAFDELMANGVIAHASCDRLVLHQPMFQAISPNKNSPTARLFSRASFCGGPLYLRQLK